MAVNVDASQLEVLQNRVTWGLAQFQLTVGSRLQQCPTASSPGSQALAKSLCLLEADSVLADFGAGEELGLNYSQVGLDLSWLT